LIGRLPRNQYGVIVVDPPWSQLAEIINLPSLPVLDMAAENCVLWLWAANGHVQVALNVMDKWKFTYKTMFTFVSEHKRKGPKGRRDGIFGSTEHCIVGARGTPLFNENKYTAFCGHRKAAFSRPLEFYVLVEAHSPSIRKYAEFYGRGPTRSAWDRFDSRGSTI
jgi:N6-adenosine-specific RNA methylase IME4